MTDKFIKFISTDETEVPITVSFDGKTDPSGNPSFAFPGGGGGGGGSIPTTSLLHFDGEDNSVEITDEAGLFWLPIGNAHISTTQSKFGGSALRLDGSSTYLRYAGNALSTRLADFTVDIL